MKLDICFNFWVEIRDHFVGFRSSTQPTVRAAKSALRLFNLIYFPTLKAGPFGRNVGFGIAPIENIVHHRKNPPGIFIS